MELLNLTMFETVCIHGWCVSAFSVRNWGSPKPYPVCQIEFSKPKVGSCESADGSWTTRIIKLEAVFIQQFVLIQ
jgi:hypothetical protein